MFHLSKRVALLSVMLSVFVPVLQADTAADLKEVHNFQLTEKKLDQFAQAVRNMAAAAEKNPELMKDDDSQESDASIDDMVATLEKTPQMKKAVGDAGLTSREFILFQMALFSSAMGSHIVDQGQKLPAEFSAEHVKFYKAHEEKFKSLQKEWEAMSKKFEEEPSEE